MHNLSKKRIIPMGRIEYVEYDRLREQLAHMCVPELPIQTGVPLDIDSRIHWSHPGSLGRRALLLPNQSSPP
jgi:hypothetical protein